MKFVVDPVFADIAAGSDSDVKLGARPVGDKVARPMIVVPAGRQVEDFLARPVEMRVAVAVGKTPNAVGVGDIELAAEQQHAERLVEVGGKDKTLFGRVGLARAAQE